MTDHTNGGSPEASHPCEPRVAFIVDRTWERDYVSPLIAVILAPTGNASEDVEAEARFAGALWASHVLHCINNQRSDETSASLFISYEVCLLADAYDSVVEEAEIATKSGIISNKKLLIELAVDSFWRAIVDGEMPNVERRT